MIVIEDERIYTLYVSKKSIKRHAKTYYLGRFSTIEEAEKKANECILESFEYMIENPNGDDIIKKVKRNKPLAPYVDYFMYEITYKVEGDKRTLKTEVIAKNEDEALRNFKDMIETWSCFENSRNVYEAEVTWEKSNDQSEAYSLFAHSKNERPYLREN